MHVVPTRAFKEKECTRGLHTPPLLVCCPHCLSGKQGEKGVHHGGLERRVYIIESSDPEKNKKGGFYGWCVYLMRAGVLYLGLFLGAPRETRQLSRKGNRCN